MTTSATRWADWMRRYPVAPPVLLYFFALPVHAAGSFVWGPAEYLAIALALIGVVGSALVCALVLASTGSMDRPRLWAGMIGALVLGGLQVAALVSPDSNSIGAGLLVLVGWVALGVGAFARRSSRTSFRE